MPAFFDDPINPDDDLMKWHQIKQYCRIDQESASLLEKAMNCFMMHGSPRLAVFAECVSFGQRIGTSADFPGSTSVILSLFDIFQPSELLKIWSNDNRSSSNS